MLKLLLLLSVKIKKLVLMSVFSLVIPPGSTTPVHDYLAWGLIGLYKANQEETVYGRVDNSDTKGHAQLQITEVRKRSQPFVQRLVRAASLSGEEKASLKLGGIYRLLPPDGDIHAVKTTSQSASVSLHLLSNDTGCALHHQFILESHSVKFFRSGYSNAPYKKEEEKEYA